MSITCLSQTIKAGKETATPKGSQGYAAGNLSVGRGDLDHAIRSMREGKRRNRPARPLSKIFLDGTSGGGRPQSRYFD
jgi:diaphanous 1